MDPTDPTDQTQPTVAGPAGLPTGTAQPADVPPAGTAAPQHLDERPARAPASRRLLAFRVLAAGGPRTRVTVLDINESMLRVGAERARERKVDEAGDRIAFVTANAEPKTDAGKVRLYQLLRWMDEPGASVPRSRASASQATRDPGWPGGRCPETTVNSWATPRWVTGMPARAGTARAEVRPGTTVTGTPAAAQASSSSKPRSEKPKLYSMSTVRLE